MLAMILQAGTAEDASLAVVFVMMHRGHFAHCSILAIVSLYTANRNVMSRKDMCRVLY